MKERVREGVRALRALRECGRDGGYANRTERIATVLYPDGLGLMPTYLGTYLPTYIGAERAVWMVPFDAWRSISIHRLDLDHHYHDPSSSSPPSALASAPPASHPQLLVLACQ